MIIVGGLKFGAIYALAALGIVVIHKATRTVNFAHGAFVLAGAWATYGVVEVLKIGYWPAYVLVPIATGLLAAAVELVMLRPIRRADMFAVITSTIFIGIGLSEVYRLVQNTEMMGLPNPVSGPPIFIGDVIVTKEQIWVFAGAILSSLVGLAIFGYARLGRGLRAMAANPRGAVLCGYSADAMNAMAWFIGGALAGLAGVFAAPSKGISPDLAISMITAGFVAAVIGGFDSLRGALLGGLILGIAETLAAGYVSSAMKNAVSFLLLFVVLLWRPQGLFPEARIRDV
jgi:branched-chain amino acid transport system permease protein